MIPDISHDFYVKGPFPKMSYTCLPSWLEKCYAQKKNLPHPPLILYNLPRRVVIRHNITMKRSMEKLVRGFPRNRRMPHWVTRGSAKHYFKPFKQTFFALAMKLLHRHAVTAIFGYSLVQKLA